MAVCPAIPTFTATGSEAVWHDAVFTLTASAVMFPPSPIGPIPSRFILPRRSSLFQRIHLVHRLEQCFLWERRGTVEGPPYPDTQHNWVGRACPSAASMVSGQRPPRYFLFSATGGASPPGQRSLPRGTFGQHGYQESLPASHMNRRHPGTLVILRIVPGEGIDDIGAQRDFNRCPVGYRLRWRQKEPVSNGTSGGR